MKTIAWDIDDVLNELMASWFDAWKQAHPTLALTYDGIICNPPHPLLGVLLSEYLESLDHFRRQHYLNLKPNPDVVAWFESYGTKAHHIALSAVPVDCAHFSADWVMRYFGKWIRGFHFIPSERTEATACRYDRSKAEFLKRVGYVDFFIDDSPQNVDGARSAGVSSYLVARPWNSGGQPMDVILTALRKEIGA